MIDREIVVSVADKYNQLVAELVGKKMVRRTVRKLVFETIQEAVDVIYFLEEDTIALANLVLEAAIKKMITDVVAAELDDDCEVPSDEDERLPLNRVKQSLNKYKFANIEQTYLSKPSSLL